jgi:acyl carrier protein
LAHPDVCAAVVAAVGEPRGDKRLVAYIVPRDGAHADANDRGWVEAVKGAVSAKLPSYMLPSMFAVLRELPLTANGKVDRQHLPHPQDTARAPRAFVPPATAVERALVEVVQAITGGRPVSTHESFFDLGVDSLGIVKIHRRLCEVLGQEIPVTEVFKYPSIHLVARFVAQRDERSSVPPSIEDRKGERQASRGRRSARRAGESRAAESDD